MEKQCTRCKATCEIEMFTRCHRYKDGRTNTCKNCRKILAKNHNTNRESHKKAIAKYSKTEKGSEAYKKYYEKVKKTGRHYVYTVIQRAIKSGKITRTNKCSACNVKGKTHFHHHSGYEKPNILNVVELCPPCHGIQHKKEMAGGL